MVVVSMNDLRQLMGVHAGVAAGRARPLVGFLTVSSRRSRHQLRHPDQVVGGGHEIRPEAVACETPVAALAPAADGLAPAEDFLDPLPRALAQRVAGMPCSPATQVGAAVSGAVLRLVTERRTARLDAPGRRSGLRIPPLWVLSAVSAPAAAVRPVRLELSPSTSARADARGVAAPRCLATDHRPVGFLTAAPAHGRDHCGHPGPPIVRCVVTEQAKTLRMSEMGGVL
jgi:hypothetical protein